MSSIERINARLAEIRAAGRYRELPRDAVTAFADFASNDYLALASDARMVEAMRYVKRVGSGGARLLGGRHREHALLEDDLARWTGRERALLFSSGYLAAIGAIPAVGALMRAVYSDERNHASLIDGVRLCSRIERRVYPHLALPPERSAPALVVTESIYGMDATVLDVRSMLERLGPDDLLLVDEAHALGVTGPEGGGLLREFDDPRILVMGTLSKAVGAAGGFIAGPAAAVELLTNTARGFIFDTALPPAVAFAARAGVMLAQRADDARARLFAKRARLVAGLRLLGIETADAPAPIVPVLLGDESHALAVMDSLLRAGIHAPAVRPPTVPAGTSRLRISLRADHTDEQIDRLLEALETAL